MRHFLVAAHGVNHATGREKQQALEERVSHQVEHARSVSADAEAQEHIAELGNRGIRQYFLDVGLHQADGRGKERGERADHGDNKHGERRTGEQRIHARHHVHAGGNHGRRVNQRADRRGAFHRVRQPDVQRNLRGLANGANKEQQTDSGQNACGAKGFDRHPSGLLKNRDEIHGMKSPEQEQNADGESQVADARGDKSFLAGADRGLLQEPETDQQVAAQAHAFPAHEHQHHVRGQHQRQHEKYEQVQVGKETVVAVFMRHVAGGINVHQQADESDHEQHDHGELIDLQREVNFENSRGNPGEVVADPGNLLRRKLREFANRFHGGEEGERDGSDADGVDHRLGPVFAQQAIQGRAQQGQGDDDPEMIEYRH